MKTTIFQFVFCILVIATTVLSSYKKEEQSVEFNFFIPHVIFIINFVVTFYIKRY